MRCGWCDEVFMPTHGLQKYCGAKCRRLRHNVYYEQRVAEDRTDFVSCPRCHRGGRHSTKGDELCHECRWETHPRRQAVKDEGLRAEAIKELCSWRARTGDSPSGPAWTQRNMRPTQGQIKRVFGSWNKALEAAGLDTRKPGERELDSARKVRLLRNRNMVTAGWFQESGIRHRRFT